MESTTDIAADAGHRHRRDHASLYIYLTHYQVYPLFGGHPVLGVVASVVVGVVLTHLVTVLRKRIRGRLRPLSSTRVPALR
ncbi:MAG: hypothetical protein QOJ20_4876 [Mycobacterium sp.]|jgi:hypothetical protein|nr:hypothetical protein [Mycobacterium sp.]